MRGLANAELETRNVEQESFPRSALRVPRFIYLDPRNFATASARERT
jgi:hypothetical protein